MCTVKLDIEPTLIIVCKFWLLQVFPMYRRQQIIVKQYFRLLFAKVESSCLLSISCDLPTAFNIHVYTCFYRMRNSLVHQQRVVLTRMFQE